MMLLNRKNRARVYGYTGLGTAVLLCILDAVMRLLAIGL